MADSPRLPPGLVLAVAVVAISSAAVLFRMAEGVHPIAAAFWRTGSVGLLLAPALRTGGLRSLQRRDGLLMALAGAFLALHFWAWLESLQHTTVLRSTLLVCLTPVWAGLLEWLLLQERPSSRTFLGIGVALVGVGLMSLPGAQPGGGSLLGDGLAVAGGVLSASYLLVGRSVRQRVGIGPYGSLVCLATAAWLLPASFAMGIPLSGFTTAACLALAGLTLGPQLLGHIGLNYAVGYLPAAVVTAAVLLEPVGAAVLGAVFLGEVPGPLEIAGAVVVLAGVGLATLQPRPGAAA
ncbi:MAG: DMT family transporter [Myxococcota bacterium]|nr:DMT family transporter [Myxococcota bacterium]